MDEQQNKGLQYSDSDIAKLTGAESNEWQVAEDEMFEDLYAPDSGTQDVWNAGDAADNASWEWDTQMPADTQPEWDNGWDEGLNVDNIDASNLSPEVMSILDSIDTSDTAADNAWDNVNQALEGWDINQQRQAIDDLRTAINERDRQIEQLIRQVANERAESDRLLDENMLANTNNRESQRFMDALSDNPIIKDILVYSMHWDDENSQAKIKELARQFYEETNWVSVDDMMEARKINEKMNMGDWFYDTTGTSPKWTNSLGWMLEDLS